MSERKSVTNLTEAQWRIIQPFVCRPSRRGRPHLHSRREVIDTVQYVVRTGCQWRMLPHDFPKWRTVYEFYACWRDDGTWETMNAQLREQVRRRARRKSEPRIGVLDSQSVKTSDQAGERGFDAGKKGQRKKAALAR